MQEALYYGVFRFLFRQPQTHKFGQLVSRDFSHRRFVHQTCVGVRRVDLGSGEYARPVEDYAVAFDVPEAGVFAYDVGIKLLTGIAARNAAADYVAGAVLPFQGDAEAGYSLFLSVRQQFSLTSSFAPSPTTASVILSVYVTPPSCVVSISSTDPLSSHALVTGSKTRLPPSAPSP